MLFNSYVFLFAFLPVALGGYYLLAHRFSDFAAKLWLAASSFVFYSWWNPVFLILLAGSMSFNYSWSLLLKGDDEPTPGQRGVLALGVAANLLLLFYFKYLFPLLGFFRGLGWTHLDYGSVVLPIGISFFTFTQIGYLVDCHQGLVRERNLLNYILFVTFFPHLIAGPILHHREIMPQFANPATYRFRAENLAVGLSLFAAGMIKKVLLADTIAPWAEAGFAHPHQVPLLLSWSYMLAYSMQLYFDFSGYSDMAVALGIMFGVKLPLNFNSPYKSLSIIDFWQRWHMTLTRYLTLLLYNPIALWIGRRRARAGLPMNKQAAATPRGFATMIVFPTFTTMFLAGVWHGAGLTFIVYGLLHGCYLTINHAWRIMRPPATKSGTSKVAGGWSTLWRIGLTYLAVLVAQIFFRADNVGDAMTLLAGGLGIYGSGFPLAIPLRNVHYFGPLQDFLLSHHLIVVAVRDVYNEVTRPLAVNGALILALASVAFCAPNTYELLGSHSPALGKLAVAKWRFPLPAWRPSHAWAVSLGGLLFLTTLYFHHTSRFLYFQF
jgi:D-alanyl-lipoteichoic acid acyltransferase DltB (MBOAT superfamily)